MVVPRLAVPILAVGQQRHRLEHRLLTQIPPVLAHAPRPVFPGNGKLLNQGIDMDTRKKCSGLTEKQTLLFFKPLQKQL